MGIRKEDALLYHRDGRPGKIEIAPTKPLSTIRDLALAYSPGVAYPCLEIAADTDKVYDYTARGNVVAVISNGTAVLGLGNIGAEASKPVMEGKAVLFKKYADIDSIDLEVRATDVDEFITVVKNLEPSFGGINLEDIKAPECFEIETRLQEAMSIPVMHDDQHGTAIITSAALLNALELTGRRIEDVRMAVAGAGAAAVSCVKLYLSLGLRRENVVMVDVKGVLHKGRTDLHPSCAEFATDRTDVKVLADVFAGADVFLGLSAGNIVDESMLSRMNPNPIVFALANPDPEISFERAMACRSDIIMATGRSDYPNQVNNVLGFPYVFRGALDVRARRISEGMKLAAVRAIAALAREPVPESIGQMYGKKLSFGRAYLIPKPMDRRLITRVSMAVARAAIEGGLARRPITDWGAYEDELNGRLGLNKGLVRHITQQAQLAPKRILFPGAESIKILRAARILVDEKIAAPILVGDRARIQAQLRELEMELDVEVLDPEERPEIREGYARAYYERRQRQGITLDGARARLRHADRFAMMALLDGRGDAVLTGVTHDYVASLRAALEIVGLEPNEHTAAGLHILNAKSGIFFFADTVVNKDPDAEQLAEIGRLAARAVRFFGVAPRIAMLSYSNFGSSPDEAAAKMARAAELLRARCPDIVVDGDVQANVALRPDLCRDFFPFSPFAAGAANTLVFPNLASANVAFKLVQEIAGVEVIGPVLLGIDKPVHVVPLGSTVREIVNMAAIAVVDAQGNNEFF
jgi:malate dehydrogenase (oxaloacetate-decarboxylating)(NADP+)